MIQDLVTVVRYRTIIEEIVISRQQFDELNNAAGSEDCDIAIDAENTFDDLPFCDWGWGACCDFVEYDKGYCVFQGDVTSDSDDRVYSRPWQHEFPLQIQ